MPVAVFIIIAASGFYYAKASYTPEQSFPDIGGDVYFLNPGGSANHLAGSMSINETDAGSAGFFQRARLKINKNIRDNFSEESAAFLMSIITGERILTPKETRDAFNSTGLAHILSISGAHFGLLLFILFRIFRFSVKKLPYNLFVRLSLHLTPSQIAAILCVPFMIGYLGISGMSVPAIRAFIMINLFLFGLMIQRKGFWLNTLLFAAVIIILIQPNSILDLSFQLSFIAVLGIGIVSEYKRDGVVERWSNDNKKSLFHRFISSLLHYSIAPLKISLAATIATAPLVAYYFHYFSVISPLTNLIFTPVIGFIILPAALVLSFVSLVFNVFPLHSLIDAITSLVIALIKMTAQLNFIDIKIPAFPSILLITFYLGVMVYIVVGNRREAMGDSKNSSGNPIAYGLWPIALPIMIAFIPIIIYSCIKILEYEGMRITYIDVGQGDSAVIELPDKKTLVLDTGRKGFQTAGYLRYKGIKTIDAVILSHGQSDHAGGMRYLLKNFKVHEIWDNGRLVYPEDFLANMHENITHRKLQRGDIVEGKGYRITVLHPYDGSYTLYSDDNDENNDSIVLKIQSKNNSFLFTGDIEEEAEDDIAHLEEYLKSGVLKIAHHGSKTSTSQAFLSAVSPEVAVISVGRKNTYGHPHDETIEALDGVGIFMTDKDGAIGIKELRDGGLEIKTWREFQLSEAKNTKDELLNLKKLFLIW
ncbi:MAG: DNA internalization-related competence protein ComEC/Rec2 [Nitrospirae bacterium]|nr:DNA internalization-related competence protein ComEC/Rec2 [Nitrospirota bacterium]